MDNKKMGQFISELRKSRQLTQRELAAKLHVSDKAVSKWERGLSYPDISLLSPLSNILGVTTTELINGERTGSDSASVEAVVVNALEYSEKEVKRKIEWNRNVIAIVFSIFLLTGIFVVSIVDVAISHTFSWSLIPIVSIVFMWLVFIPAIKFGVKGIFWSLVSCSVFITPFLYVLDYAINRVLGSTTMLFSMGIWIVPIFIVLIWLAYFAFKKLRVLRAIAILVLLVGPISFFINAIISKMVNEPYEMVAMILDISIPVVVAAILFAVDFAVQKKATEKKS